MPAKKKLAATKNPSPMKYVGIKNSCNNLGTIRHSIAAVVKDAKTSTYYGGTITLTRSGDFVTVYKLVPVTKITKTSSFVEKSL
jgi:hypothetical protein